MNHTADLEAAYQAEATGLPYWVARLLTQTTRNSVLARHKWRNNGLHLETGCWRVTISHGRRGRLSFRCSIKKSAVVWENEERLPVK